MATYVHPARRDLGTSDPTPSVRESERVWTVRLFLAEDNPTDVQTCPESVQPAAAGEEEGAQEDAAITVPGARAFRFELPSSATHEDISALLLWFSGAASVQCDALPKGDARAWLIFPPTLSKEDRKMLHAKSGSAHLYTASQGVGDERILTICGIAAMRAAGSVAGPQQAGQPVGQQAGEAAAGPGGVLRVGKLNVSEVPAHLRSRARQIFQWCQAEGGRLFEYSHAELVELVAGGAALPTDLQQLLKRKEVGLQLLAAIQARDEVSALELLRQDPLAAAWTKAEPRHHDTSAGAHGLSRGPPGGWPNGALQSRGGGGGGGRGGGGGGARGGGWAAHGGGGGGGRTAGRAAHPQPGGRGNWELRPSRPRQDGRGGRGGGGRVWENGGRGRNGRVWEWGDEGGRGRGGARGSAGGGSAGEHRRESEEGGGGVGDNAEGGCADAEPALEGSDAAAGGRDTAGGRSASVVAPPTSGTVDEKEGAAAVAGGSCGGDGGGAADAVHGGEATGAGAAVSAAPSAADCVGPVAGTLAQLLNQPAAEADAGDAVAAAPVPLDAVASAPAAAAAQAVLLSGELSGADDGAPSDGAAQAALLSSRREPSDGGGDAGSPLSQRAAQPTAAAADSDPCAAPASADREALMDGQGNAAAPSPVVADGGAGEREEGDVEEQRVPGARLGGGRGSRTFEPRHDGGGRGGGGRGGDGGGERAHDRNGGGGGGGGGEVTFYPIHLAAELGMSTLVAELAAVPGVVEQRDGRYNTPLAVARRAGHAGIVRILLEHGAVDRIDPTQAGPAASGGQETGPLGAGHAMPPVGFGRGRGMAAPHAPGGGGGRGPPPPPPRAPGSASPPQEPPSSATGSASPAPLPLSPAPDLLPDAAPASAPLPPSLPLPPPLSAPDGVAAEDVSGDEPMPAASGAAADVPAADS